jgi:hypothetical protein
MIREIPNYPDQPSTDTDEPYEPSPSSTHQHRSRPLPRSRPGRILRRR